MHGQIAIVAEQSICRDTECSACFRRRQAQEPLLLACPRNIAVATSSLDTI